MPTGARKIEGYSDISEQILAEASIIREVSRKDITGTPGTTTVKVYVNELATIADYVPGTGVAISNDSSSYVTINNLKEKAVNEILDGFTVATAPADLIAQRLMAAMAAAGEQIDTDGFAKMGVDGTLADGTLAAAATAAGSFVVGQTYKVTQANSAGDATTIGCAAATAVVGELFTALTDGTGLTALEAKQILTPTVSTIYDDVLSLKLALDNAKAPQAGRSLTITPEMHNLMLDVDSKLVLDTSRGDRIQTDGFVGRLLGFNVFVSTLLPADVNMFATHERGFVFGMAWMRDVMLQDLNGSGTFIGDSAVQGRWAYVTGAVRPVLIQINKGS